MKSQVRVCLLFSMLRPAVSLDTDTLYPLPAARAPPHQLSASPATGTLVCSSPRLLSPHDGLPQALPVPLTPLAACPCAVVPSSGCTGCCSLSASVALTGPAYVLCRYVSKGRRGTGRMEQRSDEGCWQAHVCHGAQKNTTVLTSQVRVWVDAAASHPRYAKAMCDTRVMAHREA